MSDFPSRLRFAISNYVPGALSYKNFASIIDLPYRTLQNYLSGERSPNLEALEKFAKNGINIHWLITGEGTPYKATELERSMLDTVFLLHSVQIIRTAFGNEPPLYEPRERDRLISFIIFNNYLRIGDVLHALSDEGMTIDEIDKALGSGEIEELFDTPPKNPKELWKARQLLKETRSREVAPVMRVEGHNNDEVGQ
ncbi:helix-turn-helix domain-containing protein [Allorhizobium undicola]|uniref:helix-turn-helix domain-containing protein n=1 Tax=Allorhizobium undicola TaxID=78527 RepID=UPI003D346D39